MRLRICPMPVVTLLFIVQNSGPVVEGLTPLVSEWTIDLCSHCPWADVTQPCSSLLALGHRYYLAYLQNLQIFSEWLDGCNFASLFKIKRQGFPPVFHTLLSLSQHQCTIFSLFLCESVCKNEGRTVIYRNIRIYYSANEPLFQYCMKRRSCSS